METAVVIAIILVIFMMVLVGGVLAACFTWYLFGPSFFANISEKGLGYALSQLSHRMVQIPEKLSKFIKRKPSEDLPDNHEQSHRD